jgi:hypothetical protein
MKTSSTKPNTDPIYRDLIIILTSSLVVAMLIVTATLLLFG